MGLGSRTAYLGGLKEYCMCPQELRSDRQCTQRGRWETEEGKDAKCKKQVRNGWATPSQADPPPEQSSQTWTAAHTKVNYLKTRNPAKYSPGQLAALGFLSPK